MTLSVHGLLLAQDDVDVSEKQTSCGYFLDFTLHSQDLKKPGKWCPWRMSLWVPEEDIKTWRDNLQSGSVFMLSYGSAVADAREDGKPFPTKIYCRHSDLKKLLI